MKKIGIFYICTSDYFLFWKTFYDTCEKFFLPKMEKHYFVFTDKINEITPSERVHVKKIDALPWPLVTLMRFHFFLSIEDQLGDMDYLMFSNSNMKFVTPITEEEFLPRADKGEELFVVTHPGYADGKTYHAPFERNKRSKAYVPYNCGNKYVIGAMNGGTKNAFLKMSRILDDRTNQDLKINYIPRWHDESMLNHYIAGFTHYRLLEPAYCYPSGMEVDYAPKIATVGKETVFDIKRFKGQDKDYKDGLPTWFLELGRRIKRGGRIAAYIFDKMLQKRPTERFD